MKANKKITIVLILSSQIFLSVGCMEIQRPFKAIPKLSIVTTGSEDEVVTLDSDKNDSMLKRFEDKDADGKSTVKSLMELTKEYTKLSDQMSELHLAKQELSLENVRLKERLATHDPELERAKAELAEANDLLVEMRIELNNWKVDVLGYRDEMREAQQVQLEALLKILELLGGEAEGEAGGNEQAVAQVSSAKTTVEIELAKALISGE